MFPRYFEIPEPVSGYDLGDFFWIVDPEGTTNLCTNPSFETNTTGWTAVGGSLARVATWQTRGVYCLEVTPGAGVNDGAYFGPLTLNSAIPFTFALDFQGAANRPYQLYFANTGGAILGTAYKFRATGRKQRVYVRSPLLGGVACRFYIAKDNHANVTPFQIDAVQIENKAYPTTYADGDQTGVVVGRTDFYWTGTPHASTSVRESQCGIGGRMYSFKELGFRILSIIGLGLAGLQPRLLPQASGGAFYQDTIITDRQFSIVGQVEGDGLAEVQRKRQAFIELLRPDSVTPSQPVSLHYIPTDNCGEPIGDELEILCVPDGDVLPMQLDSRNAERLSLPFRLYLPFTARDDGEVGATLSYQASLANSQGLIERQPNGVWRVPGGSGVLGTSQTVYKVLFNPYNGLVYIFGNFATLGGIANTIGAAIYNPVTDTVSAMGTGLTGGSPFGFDAAIDSSGNVWVVGPFTGAGGVANTNMVARWNITSGAWESVGAGASSGSGPNAIVFGPTGIAYVGGTFTQLMGVASNGVIQRSTAGVWAAMGGGITGAPATVFDMILSSDKTKVIILGNFTSPGTRMAQWDIGTNTMSAFGGTGADNEVDQSDLSPDGRLYVVGVFTTLNGQGINGVGRYNWAQFEPLCSIGGTFGIKIDKKTGLIYLGLGTLTPCGLTPLDYVAVWNGSALVYLAADLSHTASLARSFETTPDGSLYVGYGPSSGAGTTSIVSAMTAITNSGSTRAYPRFKFIGPGQLFELWNVTTGRRLYFNLTLQAGEIAVLDFSLPQNVSFTSNLRGNILGTILRGSSNDFWLAPSQNSISLFIAGSVDGNTAASLSWRETFHSVDGAIPVHALP